jgi:hypothetical protein
MKNPTVLLIISCFFLLISCKKETQSDRFQLLTNHAWQSDSLLADGIDASGSGMILEKFKGVAKFNTDGTGNFGVYPGTWQFAYSDTQILISTDSLPIPLVTIITELNANSLKINTGYPNPLNPFVSIKIRMTFKPN